MTHPTSESLRRAIVTPIVLEVGEIFRGRKLEDELLEEFVAVLNETIWRRMGPAQPFDPG